jgi:hypothetical protein
MEPIEGDAIEGEAMEGEAIEGEAMERGVESLPSLWRGVWVTSPSTGS